MTSRIQEIQGKIRDLEDQLSAEFEAEKQREVVAEKQEKLDLARQELEVNRQLEERWARQRAGRKEDEAREKVERHVRIQRILLSLPPGDLMPFSRCCNQRLTWSPDSFPLMPNSAPGAFGEIGLMCPNCRSISAATMTSRRFE